MRSHRFVALVLALFLVLLPLSASAQSWNVITTYEFTGSVQGWTGTYLYYETNTVYIGTSMAGAEAVSPLASAPGSSGAAGFAFDAVWWQ